MSFGENLTNLRRQKGWSQDDLANNLDLSRQAISKWENETSKPDIDNIKKISKIFSIKIDDLINNELPDDKAVTLDVKKEEKREKTITIIKLMIIAVIILYVISVIYKFASLLVIVNGVQKYANLNNYHYVITTYDENGLAEKEECWFKDGVSKTVNSSAEVQDETMSTYINYNDLSGYTVSGTESKKEINVNEYLMLNPSFKDGGQFYSLIPLEIRSKDFISTMLEIFNMNNFNIDINEKYISIRHNNNLVIIDNETFTPIYSCSEDKSTDSFAIRNYKIELNKVN